MKRGSVLAAIASMAFMHMYSESYADSLVNETPEIWGTISNALEMAILPVSAEVKSDEDPQFDIALRNTGTNDVFLKHRMFAHIHGDNRFRGR